MIMAESVVLPDLMRVTRHVYDELAAGHQVPRTALRRMLREAGLNGVFNGLTQKFGADTVRDMILVLEREIDRQALVGSR
jgi:hypothetical protein